MAKSDRVEEYVKHSALEFANSDGTLRMGQVFYQNAFTWFPEAEFHLITNTSADPFYIDENLPSFLIFLKTGRYEGL